MVGASPQFSRTAFPKAPVRADDLRFIVHCLRQSHCCALVGPSNTGKSILLQSLLSEEVRRQCAPEGVHSLVMVFVDCLAAEPTEQAFHGLLLGGIAEEIEGARNAENALRAIKALHERVFQSTDLGARSLFASGLRELGRVSGIRLVLILDEFDDVFQSLSPWPFRQLRALHDKFGDRLLYVVATSHRLERLRSDDDTYEFRELFAPYTRVLRLLDRTDAERFVAYLAEEEGHDLDPEHVSLSIELSGGHPGLLERIHGLLSTTGPGVDMDRPATVNWLMERRQIQKECRRLWDELEEEEQEGLLALVRGDGPAVEAEQRQELEAKGLVVEREDGDLVIFSPVFEVFVQTEQALRDQATAKGIHCDLETGQVWVDDQEVTWELSKSQCKLVRLLYQKHGLVCTYDEIAEGVWGVGEGVSSAAIRELVKRVRKKIEPDWRNPRYILTVPRIGCRMDWPE